MKLIRSWISGLTWKVMGVSTAGDGSVGEGLPKSNIDCPSALVRLAKLMSSCVGLSVEPYGLARPPGPVDGVLYRSIQCSRSGLPGYMLLMSSTSDGIDSEFGRSVQVGWPNGLPGHSGSK